MNETAKSYTLALLSEDENPRDHSTDTYTILGDKKPLLKVEFNWDNDSAKVTSVSGINPSELPFIVNAFHLIGVVHERLCELVGNNDSFYEAFFDEDGNKIEHSIEFGIRQAIPSVTGL